MIQRPDTSCCQLLVLSGRGFSPKKTMMKPMSTLRWLLSQRIRCGRLMRGFAPNGGLRFAILVIGLLPSRALGAAACLEFDEASLKSRLQVPALIESSGLACSRQFPDLLWSHNDSGGGPFVYAFRSDGTAMGRLELDGVDATDWEALGLGPCGDQTCLFIGDIGDNAAARSKVTIWRVPEPPAPGSGHTVRGQAERLDVVYPEGPRDAEGLAVDPKTGDLLIVEKNLDRFASAYRIPAAAWNGSREPIEAELLTRVLLEGGTEALLVTQADIDPTGSELFLGTYGAGYRLALLRSHGVVTDFAPPLRAPVYGDGQCEAMSYSASGLRLYFTCEASPTPLAQSNCKRTRAGPEANSNPPPNEADSVACHCGATSIAPSLCILIVGGFLGRRRRRSKTRSLVPHGRLH